MKKTKTKQNKKHNTVRRAQKSNRKLVETVAKLRPLSPKYINTHFPGLVYLVQ